MFCDQDTRYAKYIWLSQWGSKYLGDQNYSAIEILRYYYGNDMYINEAEEISAIVSAMVKQRTSMGLTQRELASMCGIPQSSVARIESCKTTPNLVTLLTIFQHLGLRLTVTPSKPIL